MLGSTVVGTPPALVPHAVSVQIESVAVQAAVVTLPHLHPGHVKVPEGVPAPSAKVSSSCGGHAFGVAAFDLS